MWLPNVSKIVALLIVAGVIALCAGAYNGLTETETGEGVARVDWLPAAASDVNFFRSYSFTAYDFAISERGFLDWSNENGWKVERLTGGTSTSIARFARGLDEPYPQDLTGTATEAEQQRRFELQQAHERRHYHRIERGWFYVRRQSNGGGTVVGYDLANGRAYYQESPR